MATWPSTLPQYLEQEGFSLKPQEQIIRTPTSVGPVKIRRRFSAAVTEIQGKISITLDQYNTLMDFYNTDCVGGSIAFDWIHPITQDTVSMRFKESPSISSKSGNYLTVNLALEILP